MADFDCWERETLNRFAHDATRRLLDQQAQIEQLTVGKLSSSLFLQLSDWLDETPIRRAVEAFPAGLARQIAYALELAVLPEVRRLRLLNERLLRGEFICRKCSLRKDGEHDRPADF